MEGYDFARFGIAISNIGDVDRNGYNDIAIGAPLEVDSPGSSGSVYIYNGFSDGIRMKHSQVESLLLLLLTKSFSVETLCI